jgi:hypothetical protein
MLSESFVSAVIAAVSVTTLGLLMAMIFIASIALLVQAMLSTAPPRPALQYRNDERKPRNEIQSSESSKSADHPDVDVFTDSWRFTGNDIPFHIVKEMSNEMSWATRKYLRRMDQFQEKLDRCRSSEICSNCEQFPDPWSRCFSDLQ